MVVIGQDGAATGKALFDSLGQSIGMSGTVLGLTSLAAPHENIGWRELFNIASGEFDVPAFANGEVAKDKESLWDTLNENGYVFGIYDPGNSGTYCIDSHVANAITEDLNYWERVKVIYKAIRGLDNAAHPYILSPLPLEDDGTLEIGKSQEIENALGVPLTQMEQEGNISGFTIIVDRDVSSNELNVEVRILPVNTSRSIEIVIGYTLTLTT